MKKPITLLCVLLMLCVLLCACGEKKPADSTQQTDPPAADSSMADIYAEIKSSVELPDMVELKDTAHLDRYYGIDGDQVTDFAGGIDSSGVTMTEIVLITAADKAAADEVEAKLNTRLQSKLQQNKNYNPEQAEIIEKCKVDRHKNFVTLILHKDAETINGIIQKHLTSGQNQ